MGLSSGSKSYRDMTFISDVISVKGTLIVRLDSDLRFFTTNWFREKINSLEKERNELGMVSN
jgi:hypothetical protein